MDCHKPFMFYSVTIFCLHPDINECNTTNGGCEQICTNAIGSFVCNCTVGYQLDGNELNCTGMLALPRCCFPAYHVLFMYADVDECERNEDNCHENANCTNTEGSFTCFCNPGYTGDGINCTSKIIIVMDDQKESKSFEVVITCFGSSASTDVDECTLGEHTCNVNANCTDTDGSFNCTCREGFEGNGFNCTGDNPIHRYFTILNEYLFNSFK